MESKYDLIIWDVDGTLLDTSEGIMTAVKYTLENSVYKVPDDTVLKSFIGPPLQESFIRICGVPEEKARELVNDFRLRYKEQDLLKATSYEGILSLVKNIFSHGIKQSVATYKRQDLAEELLKELGFSKYMKSIYGSDYEGKLTKKDIIEKVIIDSEVKSLDRIVMIGDSDGDQKGASQVGIDFIGVTYGFGFKKGNKDSGVKFVDNVHELRELLYT